MTRFIFIRHGNSEGNRMKIFCGHTDVPLTDLGRKQASLAAEYLKNEPIDIAYASDLARAYETGRIVAEPHGLTPLPNRELREIFGGHWETLTYPEIAERYPSDSDDWYHNFNNCRPTGGESVGELYLRVNREIDRLAKLEDGKCVLIATHQTPIRMLLRRWYELGAIDEIKYVLNTSVSIADYDSKSGKVEVELLCENGFLGELVSD